MGLCRSEILTTSYHPAQAGIQYIPLVYTTRQIASRTRVNVMGAIELSTMKVVSAHSELVNGETTVDFLRKLKSTYRTTVESETLPKISNTLKNRINDNFQTIISVSSG
jgi:hypothetical protein